MKKSVIKLTLVSVCIALATSVFAGGPPMLYPSTSNSSGMTSQETLEVTGKIKLMNAAGAQHPADKMLVIGPDRIIKERPIPPISVKPGPPSSSGAWQLNGGSTLWTNKNVGIGFNSPSAKLDVKGDIRSSETITARNLNISTTTSTNRLETTRIVSSDPSGLIGFGNNTLFLAPFSQRIFTQQGSTFGITLGNPRVSAPTGDWFTDWVNGFSQQLTQLALGTNAIAIGYNLRVAPSANYAMVIGSGSQTSTINLSNTGYLENTFANSLVIGFDSDKSTLVVGPSSGLGTSGNVGIGDFSSALPSSKLTLENADRILFDNTSEKHSNIAWRQGGVEYASFEWSANPREFRWFLGGGVPTLRMTLHENGNLDVCGVVKSKEIIVDATWCDFVFDPEYNKMDWKAKKDYYTAKRMLPYMDSAKEIEKNGLKMSKNLQGIMWNLEENRLDITEILEMQEKLMAENQLLKEQVNKQAEDIKELMNLANAK